MKDSLNTSSDKSFLNEDLYRLVGVEAVRLGKEDKLLARNVGISIKVSLEEELLHIIFGVAAD